MTRAVQQASSMARIFSLRQRVQFMLDVEAALARSQARLEIIPTAAALAITEHCLVDAYDVDIIEDASVSAGNLAIPLVTALTTRVAATDSAAAGYVHWGATSQDILDTALILQIREALAVIEPELAQLCNALATQTNKHRMTVMAGRTWLQHASPVTLGAKLALCLGALQRDRVRLSQMRDRLFVVQFGGAVANLAALGERGPHVARALAGELGLDTPDTPWHTQRDRLCELAAVLGIVTANVGKLARDISLLTQTEVGEANEPAEPGRGASSTLPQKRNPVACAIALASAIQVPGLLATMFAAAVQEHERGLGNWPAEWETLPRIIDLSWEALRAMTEVVDGIEVDVDRMRSNMDLSSGQLFSEAVQSALAPVLGRSVAHKLVAEVVNDARTRSMRLDDALRADARIAGVLDGEAISRIFDPTQYLGANQVFIDNVVSRHHAMPSDSSSD